nr:DNA repair protein RadC [Pegethrix bostrychoides GSE-TBD4-15B]
MSLKFDNHVPDNNLNFSHSWSLDPDSNFVSFSLEDGQETQSIRAQYSHAQIRQYSLQIRDLPAGESPRDKLIQQGAQNLSNSELLSVLAGTGQGAGGLGQIILQELSEGQVDLLKRFQDVTLEELTAISGVGIAKATTILAAIEFGKRVYYLRPSVGTVIDDPAVAAAVLSDDLMWQNQERVATLLLDVKHRLISHQVISIGTATEALVHPREIFQAALRRGAVRVIVAHNHPSGSLEPSQEDLELTRQLLQGAQFLSIPLLDHLILGNGNFTSLRQTT